MLWLRSVSPRRCSVCTDRAEDRTREGRGGVQMLRRLSVRGKILATLAVPVIVLFFAAGLFSLAAFDDAKVAGQAQDASTSAPRSRPRPQALSDERDGLGQHRAGRDDREDRRGPQGHRRGPRRPRDGLRGRRRRRARRAGQRGARDGAAREQARPGHHPRRAEARVRGHRRPLDQLHRAHPRVARGPLRARRDPDRPAARGRLDRVRHLARRRRPARCRAPADAGCARRRLPQQARRQPCLRDLTGIVADTNAARSTATSAVGALGVDGLLVPRPNVEYAGLRRLLATGDFSAVTTRPRGPVARRRPG